MKPSANKEWVGGYLPLLSKLSIVMFTYERQRYALRNMRFWSGSAARLYVLDGSAKAIEKSELSSLAPNVIYLHWPIPLLDRFASIADVISTEYVAFMADDDFFVPSAVEASIYELENDADVVACCGQGLEKALSSDLVVHQSAIEACRSGNRKASLGAVDLEDPLERMAFHMDPFCPSSFYAVCRSHAWRTTVRLMAAQKYSSGLVAELLFELSMSFYGKIKIINELMWLRSNENTSNTEGFELAFDTWYTDRQYLSEVSSFLNAVADTLGRSQTRLETREIRSGLERACCAYVTFCTRTRQPATAGNATSNRAVRSQSAAFPRMVGGTKYLISILPASMIGLIPVRLRFRPYADLARALESGGLKVDWVQFAAILRIVREFHNCKARLRS
jgi:glycosyltransferase domain-containing protein